MSTVSKIAHASDIELLCITYEMFLEAVQTGMEMDCDKRKEPIEQAKKVLLVLTENLNLEIELGARLFNLYVYIQNLLINHYKQTEKLKEAYELMEIIYMGYKTVETSMEKKESMMENTQHIYAGITYGKGYLHEHVDTNEARGYKA